jgi:hypothetical protein
MVYNTQNYWGFYFVHRPLFYNTTEHKVSQSGSVSILPGPAS